MDPRPKIDAVPPAVGVHGPRASRRLTPLSKLTTLLRRRIVKDAVWVTIGMGVSSLAFLAGTRIITQLVAREVYGLASLLLGVAILARNALGGPVLQAQLRFYGELAGQQRLWQLRQTVGGMLWRLVGALVIVVLVAGVVFSLTGRIGFWAFLILAALIAADTGRTYEANLLGIARRQKPLAWLVIIESILRPAIVVIVVLMTGPSVESVLIGSAAAAAIALGLAVTLVPREGLDGPPGPRVPDIQLRRKIWIYALPLAPLAVFVWITGLSDRYIIEGMLGAGQVGLYAATYGLVSQPFLLAQGLIARTTTAVYYDAVAKGDVARERSVFRASLAATIALCGCGWVLVSVLRHWIAWAFLAPAYRGGAELMPWIAGGYALYAVGSLFEMRLYAGDRTGRILIIESLVAATAVAMPILLVHYWGVLGAAVACPIYFSVMVAAAAMLWRNRRDQRGHGAGHLVTPPGWPQQTETGEISVT